MRPWTNKSLSLGVIGLLLIALGTSLCFLSSTIFQQILQSVSAISMIGINRPFFENFIKFILCTLVNLSQIYRKIINRVRHGP